MVSSTFNHNLALPVKLSLNDLFPTHNLMQSSLNSTNLLLNVLRVENSNLQLAWLFKVVNHNDGLNVKIHIYFMPLSFVDFLPNLRFFVVHIYIDDWVALWDTSQC